MEYPSIIGLCGDIGSGKDTVAEFLQKGHGYVRVQFACKLKEVALDVFGPLGLQDHHMFGTPEDPQAGKDQPISGIVDAAGVPRTGRSLLQWLGTEGFRSIDPDVWVKYAMARYVDSRPGMAHVFSDVRFANEFEAIRARGGVVWEVSKVGGPDHDSHDHVAEQQWKQQPKDAHLVARHGDLQALYDATDLVLAQVE